MATEFPERGQKAPQYWDEQLKAYVDESAEKPSGVLFSALRKNVTDPVVLLLGDSTANETSEWFYSWLLDVGQMFPTHTITHRLWDDAGQVYDAPTTAQTGTGPHTLTVYNGSVPGANADYINGTAARVSTMIPVRPTTILFSYGYNFAALTDYRPVLYPTIRLVQRFNPGAEIVVCSQPPKAVSNTDFANHLQRSHSIRKLALTEGYQLIDACQAFFDYGDFTDDLILPDLLHPNAEGSRVWATEALRSFSDKPSRVTPSASSPEQDTLWIPATAFQPASGSPALVWDANVGAHGWALDPAAVESVAVTANPPLDWEQTIVRLYFSAPTGSTGIVKWTPRWGTLANYAMVRSGTGAPAAATGGQVSPGVTAGAVTVTAIYAVTSDGAAGRVREGRPLTLTLTREATDSADTCPTDVNVLGVLFLRAS